MSSAHKAFSVPTVQADKSTSVIFVVDFPGFSDIHLWHNTIRCIICLYLNISHSKAQLSLPPCQSEKEIQSISKRWCMQNVHTFPALLFDWCTLGEFLTLSLLHSEEKIGNKNRKCIYLLSIVLYENVINIVFFFHKLNERPKCWEKGNSKTTAWIFWI